MTKNLKTPMSDCPKKSCSSTNDARKIWLETFQWMTFWLMKTAVTSIYKTQTD